MEGNSPEVLVASELDLRIANGPTLLKHAETLIGGHVKVTGDRSPFDGDYIYWSMRMGHHPLAGTRLAKLIVHQKGRCDYCKQYLLPGVLLETHHRDGNHSNNRSPTWHWFIATAMTPSIVVPVTTAILLRSRMKRKFHVRF